MYLVCPLTRKPRRRLAELTRLDIGLRVGQATVHQDPDIHTGVTLIFPRGLKDTALHPCYAATHDLNGAGELTGCHMLHEWGYLRNVCLH